MIVASVGVGVMTAASLAAVLPPIFIVVAAAYLVVGTLIVERRAGNRIGLILYAIGLLVAGFLVADAIVRLQGETNGGAYVAWAVTLIDAPLFALLAFLFLLFPDGRLPSPRWRWVGLGVVVSGAIALVGTAVIPGTFAYYPDISNPFGIADQRLSETMPTFYLLTIVGVTLAALSLIGRWRVGGPTERAQLKWVATAAELIAVVMAAYAILFGPGAFNDVADLAVGLAFGFFPIAIGIAILRYHLFEIDRLVSRTIAYSVLTGGLIVVFLVVNLALTTAFSSMTGVDSLAVAASTLVAAALFTPIRRRVQQVVDRRFDRARYDADRTSVAFSARLRYQVDLPAVTADLDTTVRAAIAPATLDVWLRRTAR